MFTTKKIRDKLKEILQSIADYNGVTIQSMEVMTDHVHLLITFLPKFAASDVVKLFKGSNARKWFKAFPNDRKSYGKVTYGLIHSS